MLREFVWSVFSMSGEGASRVGIGDHHREGRERRPRKIACLPFFI